MKQYLILIATALTLFASCKSNPKQVKLIGELNGLATDTIYIYGNDELSDFITPIPVTAGEFSLSMDMDTTQVQAMLYINDNLQYPIYLERGKTIHIKGDVTTSGSIETKGSPLNQQFTAFYHTLPQPVDITDTLTLRLVKEYIHNHHASLINIYLLDRFFVQTPSPDLAEIKALIGIIDGSLQDKPYVGRLSEWIDQAEKADVGKTAPSFTITNAEGKNISRSEFRDRYLLLTFWSFMSDSSHVTNRELKQIYKRFPPKTQRERDREAEKLKNDRTFSVPAELNIASISLDMDKAGWKTAIKKDTLKWEQLNDFSGWNSPVVKQYTIPEIPYNILIDRRGVIIARGIRGETLTHTLDSLLKKN